MKLFREAFLQCSVILILLTILLFLLSGCGHPKQTPVNEPVPPEPSSTESTATSHSGNARSNRLPGAGSGNEANDADLAEPTGARALFDAVAATGLAVDVLVNNAGFGDLNPFARADLGKLLRMIQVNITALTELTGLFLPGMLARGKGQILNVGSVAGFQINSVRAVIFT